jgi:predicted dehydrogenase
MHAGMLATQVPGAQLVAVADAVPAVAKEVGQELGVPAMENDSSSAIPVSTPSPSVPPPTPTSL